MREEMIFETKAITSEIKTLLNDLSDMIKIKKDQDPFNTRHVRDPAQLIYNLTLIRDFLDRFLYDYQKEAWFEEQGRPRWKTVLFLSLLFFGISSPLKV